MTLTIDPENLDLLKEAVDEKITSLFREKFEKADMIKASKGYMSHERLQRMNERIAVLESSIAQYDKLKTLLYV